MSDNTYYEDFYSRTDWNQNNFLITIGTKAYLNILTDLHKKKHPEICDVGCATGRFTNAISTLGYSVKGFDYSTVAIKKAKKTYPQIDFTCQDATDLKYTEKFDVFFVNGFSLFNTLDLKLVENTITYWSQFLNTKGIIINISKTDFSGKVVNGWQYHTEAQIDEMYNVAGFTTQTYFIHSSLKYLCLLPFVNFWLKTAVLLSHILFGKLLKLPLRSVTIITKND